MFTDHGFIKKGFKFLGLSGGRSGGDLPAQELVLTPIDWEDEGGFLHESWMITFQRAEGVERFKDPSTTFCLSPETARKLAYRLSGPVKG